MHRHKFAVYFRAAAVLALLASQPQAFAEPEPSANSPAAPAPQVGPTVEGFFARLESGSRAVFESSRNDPAHAREGCRRFLNQVLFLDAMAMTVAADVWNKMTVPQRRTFRAAFEHRMVSSCTQQFAFYDGGGLRLMGVRTPQPDVMLATVRFGANEDGKLVTWRLRSLGTDSLRAVDIISDGRSVIGDARSEFSSVWESVNGDIEALISYLQR